MNLNELDLHLLSQLKTAPMTGYDLKKSMKESHVWRASHQQTYRNLNKLAVHGLVSFTLVPQEGKPDRKVYSLTDAGATAYQATTQTIQPTISNLHSIRTVMLNAGNPAYFAHLAQQLTSTIDSLEAKVSETEDPLEQLSMNREIHLHAAELKYCGEVLAHFDSLNSAVA